MDKTEFVAKAPIYYALAIAAALHRATGAIPEFKIKSQYTFIDDSDGEMTLLGRSLIWDRAIQWLSNRDMIRIKSDPFGPPIFFRAPNFMEEWDDLTTDEELPFLTYQAAGMHADWLGPALHSIENYYVNMEIKEEDFEDANTEWTPIQLDADDPGVKKAISSLEVVIEEVRSDNGYNASHPHERDHVLEGLQGTLDKFKSSSISAGYLRIAMERLGMLARRFGGTLKEAAIVGARSAIVEFTKKHFGEFMSYLWKWPF